jgi:hypothetical protein
MQSTAYIYVPQQNERRVSLSRLSMILASFAFWAVMIGGVAAVLR